MSNAVPKKQRNSSIELLKIISMLIIVIAHSIPTRGELGMGKEHVSYYEIGLTADTIKGFLLYLTRSMGQVANIVFIICSAWFLVNSKKVKVDKIASMLMDTVFFSVFYMLVFVVTGEKIGKGMMLKSFFPTTFTLYWFITCYVILYAIHPLLNAVINNITKQTHFAYCIAFIVVYCGINYVVNSFYYNKLIGFIGIYFMVAYFKKYMSNTISKKKINAVALLIGTAGWLAISISANFLGNHIPALHNKMVHWYALTNPFIILMSFAIFNLFKEVNFVNGFINKIAGLMLIVYLAHANILLMNYWKFDVYDFIYNKVHYDNPLGWVFVVGGVLFVAALLVSFLYVKFIQPYIHRFAQFILKLVLTVYYKLEDIFLKLD